VSGRASIGVSVKKIKKLNSKLYEIRKKWIFFCSRFTVQERVVEIEKIIRFVHAISCYFLTPAGIGAKTFA